MQAEEPTSSNATTRIENEIMGAILSISLMYSNLFSFEIQKQTNWVDGQVLIQFVGFGYWGT